MSHHSTAREAEDRLKDIAARLGLGATGDFPRGRLNALDEGGLRMAIGVEGGAVVVHFGKPVAFVGLGPQEARALARSLIAKADAIEGHEGEVDDG